MISSFFCSLWWKTCAFLRRLWLAEVELFYER
jgi:hypothetical protein